MGPGEAIKTCFRKYFKFSGRASRSEFWWFFLLSSFVFFTLFWLFNALAIYEPAMWPFLLLMPSLFFIVPFFSCLFRRLHDLGITTLLPFALVLLMPISIFLTARYGFISKTYFRLDVSGENDELFVSDVKTDLFSTSINILPILSTTIVILLIVFIFAFSIRPSQSGSNKYGPNPNEVPS